MSETVELVELPKFGIQYSPTEIVINGKEELEEAIKLTHKNTKTLPFPTKRKVKVKRFLLSYAR
ncbi:hypothetical protein [Secundilactobacillus oryzae]|uniref:hypothetical protein n=1 Tax=Secundilactobacillus oryzae TaxID=1202668 RepID=UPI0006D03862|nr:hypothetical protein [Secundilactobacillus oryzae]